MPSVARPRAARRPPSRSEQQAPNALRRILGFTPRPDAQRDADDVVAVLDEQRGGDRRIDAAAHADDDALASSQTQSRAPSNRRQALELLGVGVDDLDACRALVAGDPHARHQRALQRVLERGQLEPTPAPLASPGRRAPRRLALDVPRWRAPTTSAPGSPRAA